MKRIFRSAVKVAGSLAVLGAATAAATTPAGAVTSPNYAYGISAVGTIAISPIADADVNNTPQVSGPVVYPGMFSTGGILDRAEPLRSYSQVGAVKVYGLSQVEQLNASLVSTQCRIIFGDPFGFTTIQGGSIVAPDIPGFPPIPLIRNPAPNTVISLGSLKITLNKQVFSGGVLTVTGIYISIPGQNLSIAVSSCGTDT